MKSVMQHNFGQTEAISTPRSSFDRSHGHKFTMDAGWLVPFYWDDVLPGDTFNCNVTAFARLATPLFPIMDNIKIDTHFFFVPYRLIWDNSKKFFGEQVDPGDSIDYQIPILAGSIASDADHNFASVNGRVAALHNYLGIPDGISPNDVDISALTHRAYSRIYSEWFRDQNLIDSTNLLTDDGPDDYNTAPDQVYLQRRGKRPDYFTSCLPWPQKGDAVTLPLGSTAPIYGTDQTTKVFNATDATKGDLYTQTSTANVQYGHTPSATDTLRFSATSSEIGLVADLTNATANTINDLREAFQVQKLLERDARGGTRYSELVRNHFGVTFYDLTYRPEYLGGGSSNINISPIAQQAPTSSGSATGVGDLSAMGTGTVNGHGFSKSFVEHGIVMGIMSARADLTYQQGLRREFSKSTRYDIYWPSLAHLGEQEVLKKEIFCDGTAADEDVFGYQERYAEYRYKPSQISGLFQSAATSSLDAWHLSQELDNTIALGQTFIEENPPLDRCVQVPSEPHFIVDTYISLRCARPIPTFATPGMIDHF